MILKDEQGNKYEFKETVSYQRPNERLGTLKPVDSWPKEGDEFWYLDSEGTTQTYMDWNGDNWDKNVKDFMGIYRTQQEAELARDRIKSLQEVTGLNFYGGDEPSYSASKEYFYLDMRVPKKYLKAWEELSK